jgi:hypothetical protein
VQIRKTLPAIAERLSTLQQSLACDINDWGAKTKQLTHINATLNDLLGAVWCRRCTLLELLGGLLCCYSDADRRTPRQHHFTLHELRLSRSCR